MLRQKKWQRNRHEDVFHTAPNGSPKLKFMENQGDTYIIRLEKCKQNVTLHLEKLAKGDVI
jgi:hypothetical protein